jgi:hypothetical protein
VSTVRPEAKSISTASIIARSRICRLRNMCLPFLAFSGLAAPSPAQL